MLLVFRYFGTYFSLLNISLHLKLLQFKLRHKLHMIGSDLAVISTRSRKHFIGVEENLEIWGIWT